MKNPHRIFSLRVHDETSAAEYLRVLAESAYRYDINQRAPAAGLVPASYTERCRLSALTARAFGFLGPHGAWRTYSGAITIHGGRHWRAEEKITEAEEWGLGGPNWVNEEHAANRALMAARKSLDTIIAVLANETLVKELLPSTQRQLNERLRCVKEGDHAFTEQWREQGRTRSDLLRLHREFQLEFLSEVHEVLNGLPAPGATPSAWDRVWSQLQETLAVEAKVLGEIGIIRNGRYIAPSMEAIETFLAERGEREDLSYGTMEQLGFLLGLRVEARDSDALCFICDCNIPGIGRVTNLSEIDEHLGYWAFNYHDIMPQRASELALTEAVGLLVHGSSFGDGFRGYDWSATGVIRAGDITGGVPRRAGRGVGELEAVEEEPGAGISP